jgi:glycine dehydrogenase
MVAAAAAVVALRQLAVRGGTGLISTAARSHTSSSYVHYTRLARIPHRRTLATAKYAPASLKPLDTFTDRHIGPDAHEEAKMLKVLGYNSMEHFVAATVPAHIRVPEAAVSDASIPPLSESELARRADELRALNPRFRSYIGMGYHNAVMPPVIQRNVSIHHTRSPL